MAQVAALTARGPPDRTSWLACSPNGEIRSRDPRNHTVLPPGGSPCDSFSCQACLGTSFHEGSPPAQRSPWRPGRTRSRSRSIERSPLSPWALRQRDLAEESQLIRDDLEQHDPFTDSVPYRAGLCGEDIRPTEVGVSPTVSPTAPLTEQLHEMIEAKEEEQWNISQDRRAGQPPPMLGGRGQRQMICINGENPASPPVIDLDDSQKQKERADAPAIPAQQHRGGGAAGPIQVDIGSPPAAPRPKREVGGGDQSPTKQPKASASQASRRTVSSYRCCSSC